MVRGVLEFEGGVGDSGLFQQPFQPVLYFVHAADVTHHDMGCEGVFRGADGPDMDMMYLLDSVHGFHPAADVFHIELFRGAIKRQPDAVLEDVPCGIEYDGRDDKPYYGVDDVPAGESDDYARYDHADGYEGICQHVHVGGPDVEVSAFVLVEKPGSESVDYDTYAGYGYDPFSVDFHGVDNLFDAFEYDDAHSREQYDSVGDGDEDGGFLVSVGVSVGCVACRKDACHQCQRHAGDIAEIVPGIGH